MRDVVDEEKKDLESEVVQELQKRIDFQMNTINRNLFKMLRQEIEKYVREVEKVEDRLDLLEKRLFDVENQLYGRKQLRLKGLPRPGVILTLTGLLLAGLGFFLPLEGLYRWALGIVGLVMIIGGLLLG